MSKKVKEEKPQGKGSKIANVIINVVLIAAMVFAFFITYTAYVTKQGNGVPEILGIQVMSVQSDSMSPFFNSGDLIIDKKVDDVTTLEVGDVISFWTIINGEKAVNTHRIVSIEDGGTYIYFVTKGDNNSMEDSLTVHQSEVIGKYQTKLEGVGKVLDFLQTSTGFLCIVGIPVAAFFIYYLVQFFRTLFEYMKKKNQLEFESQMAEKQEASAQQAAAGQAPAAEAPAVTVAAEAASAAAAAQAPAPAAAAPAAEGQKTITLTEDQLKALLAAAGVAAAQPAAAPAQAPAEEAKEEAEAEAPAEAPVEETPAQTPAEEAKEEAQA